MPQTASMSSRTNSTTTKQSVRRSVRVIMLDKQEHTIKIEVCGLILDVSPISCFLFHHACDNDEVDVSCLCDVLSCQIATAYMSCTFLSYRVEVV